MPKSIEVDSREPETSSSARPAEQVADDQPAGNSSPTHDEIALRAYECWHERGCANDSPETDWYRAELELQTKAKAKSAAASL